MRTKLEILKQRIAVSWRLKHECSLGMLRIIIIITLGLQIKFRARYLPIDKPNLRVFTTREPIGVVTTIVPWNAQLFLSATKIAPALAAGNTVVIKASEQAPAPLFKLAELIDKVGFPKGVINIITGFGDPCERVLTSHPKVARVAFTGGCEVAKQIVKITAENFAYLSLELGGKSPILVFAMIFSAI